MKLDRWQEILAMTVNKLNEPGINLVDVANRANVGYWWLLALRAERFTDPGWAKLGRTFEALFGGENDVR